MSSNIWAHLWPNHVFGLIFGLIFGSSLANEMAHSRTAWATRLPCRSVFPSFSAIFDGKMQKLPLFSCILIRKSGKASHAAVKAAKNDELDLESLRVSFAFK